MDRWHGLTDFLSSMQYWSEVQNALAEGGKFRGAVPLYEPPYLDGDRLVVPRGPGNAEDSEGYTDYSILDQHDYFSIRSSGRSRGNLYSESSESWFGIFSDAGKHFLASEVALTTRLRISGKRLEIVTRRWKNLGLAPSWTEVAQPNPGGFVDSKTYYRSDNPTRFYITVNPDTTTAFLLDLNWRDLNSALSEGIPGIEHVQMPKFSDD
ncbi:hypothetical protein M0655_02800 [Gordonia amicalis]|uniref:hypothetical protein n=1 Tax=Gordonia amicalis TaxID=89053 RepID=UPI00200A8277|nr:hypothetical protein [Gordonia amicalis]UPW14561.1 hypothetical protein M0655_02800 [Gordonia amicalis]